MERGIIQKWKQPIAYYLVNESCQLQLKSIVSEAITHLEAMDLSVVSLVSDQGSNFMSFLKYTKVSEVKPFFELNGKKYFAMYDPPHLLKSVRNNLLKYDFEFDGKVAKWAHIKELFRKDQKLPTRMALKLTGKHLNPNGFTKIKVKLAKQVLSHTLSAAINTYVSPSGLPAEAIGTAQLLKRFDTIFGCYNSLSFRDSKMCRRPFTSESPHLGEFLSGLTFIKPLKVLDKSSNDDKTKNIKCFFFFFFFIFT